MGKNGLRMLMKGLMLLGMSAGILLAPILSEAAVADPVDDAIKAVDDAKPFELTVYDTVRNGAAPIEAVCRGLGFTCQF